MLHAQLPLPAALPRLGYVGDDNRTVLEIPACPLARDEINTALAAFRQAPEFRRLRDGDAVTFRWTAADGAIEWAEVRAGPPDPPPPEYLTEQAPFGPVRVPAAGFYQVNPEVATELVRQVTAWFSAAGGGDLLDLYCGAGIFAIACARAGARRTAGIESGRVAVAAAVENAHFHHVQVRFDCQEMRAAARAKFGEFPMTDTTVIVDPPRQGLEPEVAQALVAAQPRRICYVSCDPATLTRDLKLILPAGYALRAARLFDMFPRTAHFEMAVWLENRESE